jgi:16S rRNA U1498 N3-methylase RsmE
VQAFSESAAVDLIVGPEGGWAVSKSPRRTILALS